VSESLFPEKEKFHQKNMYFLHLLSIDMSMGLNQDGFNKFVFIEK